MQLVDRAVDREVRTLALPPALLGLDALPPDWPARQTPTQSLGDEWLEAATETLLLAPTVAMPLSNAPDRNVLINHRTAGAATIRIVSITLFTLDARLFRP